MRTERNKQVLFGSYYLRCHVYATGIKSHQDTTGYDKISLTYKTSFLIVEPTKKQVFINISV